MIVIRCLKLLFWLIAIIVMEVVEAVTWVAGIIVAGIIALCILAFAIPLLLGALVCYCFYHLFLSRTLFSGTRSRKTDWE